MRTLVIHCHPSPDSFVGAVRDAVLERLRSGGGEVRFTDLYADGFDPVMSAAEHRDHLVDTPLSPRIAAYADDLRWCDSLVLVYPTWWSGQPAMLKGWIDRVWVKGVAWDLPPGKTTLRARLTNIRRITVVTTHGSSKFVNALEGEAGKRTATRALRVLCRRTCRTRWVAMYNVDRSTLEQREAFVRRVERRISGVLPRR